MDKLGNVLIQVMQDLSRISTNGQATVKVNSDIAEPEEFQRLFEVFSKGTIIEHVDLEVQSLQTKLNCSCGNSDPVESDHPGYLKCPNCGRFAEVDDTHYQLVNPNPDHAGRRTSIRF